MSKWYGPRAAASLTQRKLTRITSASACYQADQFFTDIQKVILGGGYQY